MNNQKETNNGAFIKISEQPSLYNNLEKKSVREILDEINTEDQKVALAVQRAIPQIEKLVNQIVPRMKQGGRIFYMGAGTSGRLGVLDASEIPPTFGMPNTLIIGLIAASFTTRMAASLLFQLKPTDPLTLVFATLLLIAVAALAAYLPARRAARVNPMMALRDE